MLIFLSALAFSQKLEKVWQSEPGLETPESVFYHEELDVLFVSNMGPDRNSSVDDGYISLVNLNGSIKNLHWVTGLKEPKGLAVSGNNLFVSDQNELVIIDIKEAKIEKRYTAPNAKFLNDVTIDENNVVYVSDSRDQRIYSLSDGKFSSWLYNENLKNVNGLWVDNGNLFAGNQSIWKIDIDTKEMNEILKGAGGVDGLERIDNKKFIFSNWIGKVFVSDGEKITKLLDSTIEKINTADIDYIPEKKMVLVPTFFGNSVDAYRLTW